MQRFRLLGFYVVGLVAMIGLTVWGVASRRVADASPRTGLVGREPTGPSPLSRPAAGSWGPTSFSSFR
jgi:hypothetical protein